MIRIGLVGVGKMGLSHCAIINAHPRVELVGICDPSTHVLGAIGKYTAIPTYADFDTLLRASRPQAVIIATPSRTHAALTRRCLEDGIDVFCEKPFTLSGSEATELAQLAEERQQVTQVGYHNRFVATFAEVARLLISGAIGDVTHALVEAYGPVVIRPPARTWRTSKEEGGGCLYDYAAHVIDLSNWYLGQPVGVTGTVLRSVFSRTADDQVNSTLLYSGGQSVQLCVDWSDESQRKMTTRITLWGTNGRIFADRQECQLYLRDSLTPPAGYSYGWNVRYTTDLTSDVWFYLRGEEYSAQLDYFVESVERRRVDGLSNFTSASATDRVIAMMNEDATTSTVTGSDLPRATVPVRSPRLLRRLARRRARSS